MRCARSATYKLATKLEDDEADLLFENYDSEMTSIEVQVSLSTTLTLMQRRLSQENKKDLRQTASTLTKSLELKAAENLVRVDPTIVSCPLPDAEQLHPRLFDKRAISSYCTPFDEDTWIRSVCERAVAGDVDETQRQSVERRVLVSYRELGRLVLAAVKRSPVVRDHRGTWTAPAAMRSLKGRSNNFFLRALSAPSEEMSAQHDLIKLLRIPDTIDGDDLVGTAVWVAANPDAAERFEYELDRRQHLLTRSVVRRLSTIAFLRTATGSLSTPGVLHVANELNRLCVSRDQLVNGSRVTLYERLEVNM